jgi:hypothetical protein
MNSIGIHPHKFMNESLYILLVEFHGRNKSLDDIPWMKLNSSWNIMNSHPIISFMN